MAYCERIQGLHTHTHTKRKKKKRGLVAYTVRLKVAMLKYSATCQRALEEGLMDGGALRTTICFTGPVYVFLPKVAILYDS